MATTHRIGGTTVIVDNTGRRNLPPNPALLEAAARRVEQAYGPGYTLTVKSGGQAKKGTNVGGAIAKGTTGSHRHDYTEGGGLAADFQIEAPDGHQLAGKELDPLAQVWIGVEGSMGINQKPGSAGGNWTHLDLVGGQNPAGRPAGRGEGPYWYYDRGASKYRFDEEARAERMIQAMGFPSVEAYQQARGLEADGIIGDRTTGAVMTDIASGNVTGIAPTQVASAPPQSAIASLQPPAGGTQTPTPPSALQGFQPTIPAGDFGSPAQAAISDLISAPSTTSDVDKLAGVMLAEARGEGREGMTGVGNVVLNRANATGNRFPKTIDGVINNEFAKPLGPNDVSPDEWVEARTLATQLKNGTIPDNTGGAVYFANTATASPNAYADIAQSGPVSTTIGNHTYHVDAGIGPVARGTGAPPAQRRPGPGGALGVDLGTMPAGMPPPPSRPGSFDWLGGGAPDAGLVPTPGISPLRPAIGGPGDRRPQPPLPQMRPAALGIPDPRMRPSAPQSPASAFSAPAGPLDLIPYSTQPPATGAAPGGDPSRTAAIQSIIDQGITDPTEIWGYLNMNRDGQLVGDITPSEIQTVLGQGQRNAPNAAAAIADEFAPGLPFSQIRQPAPAIPGLDRSIIAGGNFGTPETAMSLERTFPPPSPLAGIDERMDRAFSEAQSRGLARELGFNRDMMERYTAPPFQSMVAGRQEYPGSLPGAGPYFSNAEPGPTFTPPMQSMVAGRPEFPGSMPPSNLPGRFEDAFAPGPTFTPPPPASSAPMSYTDLPPISGAAGADALNPFIPPSRYDPLSSAVPGVPPGVLSAFEETDWSTPPPTGPTQPTSATGEEDIILPGTQPGAGSQLPDEPVTSYPSPMDVVIGEAGLGTPRQIRRSDPNRQPGFFGRILGGPGGGGGGSIFGIGPNGFLSNAGSFTPFTGPGAGGSSPFNQQPGGAMGTTNWRHGSVTGNPNMQGTMWNRSGDNGSVGYVTDPVTGFGHPIYSGSPNRF